MKKTKKILIALLSLIMVSMLAFSMVACGGGGTTTPDDDGDTTPPTTHTHDYTEVVEYFDATNSRFPKKLKCSCGETTTRTNVEIHTKEDYIDLTEVFSSSTSTFAKYKFEFKVDIDFGGATISPMIINEDTYGTRYEFIGNTEGVTLSNFKIEGENAGLFSEVNSDITIKNINIKDATIGSSTTKCAGGFIANIDFKAEPLTQGSNVIIINNCDIKDSTVTAGNANAVGAGGIYGVAKNNLGENREIRIDNVEINNVDITCQSAAGGIMGKASVCSTVKTLKVSANEFAIKNCEITSSAQNEAGLYAGILGDGDLSFDIQSAGGAGRIASVTVNGQAFSMIGRDYGRTGWTDANNRGQCWTGTTPVDYDANLA